MNRTNVELKMDQLPLKENNTSRHRLDATVTTLADTNVDDTVTGEWTIAQTLAQLAFWDRWAAQLLIRWRSGGMPAPAVPDWYDTAIDAALAEQWKALPIATAAALALDAATAVDREIAHLESPVLAALTASGQIHLINRYTYRNAALDKIDQALSPTQQP
jgi:hypothetical protein